MLNFAKKRIILLKYYSTNAKKSNKLYSNTVILPQTNFPLKLKDKKLIERDIQINESKAFKSLYSWQNKRLKDPTFILHDGPPYANGSLHMGHAINKILKDTIIRYKIVNGQKVSYVPGWDCHGLPIELKAITKIKNDVKPIDIRTKARNFATETINNQRKSFESFGVIGDWENAYKTYDTTYVINQIKQFFNLYERKLIYRDVKPVYWSPSTRTALAEAELEYNNKHKSLTVILRLKILQLPDSLKKYEITKVFALIWTTTPWTLPSNQAVCFNKNLEYCLVNADGDDNFYIIAKDLVQSVSNTLKMHLNILETFQGKVLESLKYKHPMFNEELPFFNSDHATATKGTGLVHTAPAHGPEDFLLALRKKMTIRTFVDENGCFTTEAGPNLHKLFVLNEGQNEVIKILKNDIIHMEEFIHSYPYDWRTKQPVILRASQQWFIDTNSLKERAIELLNDVEIIPKLHSEDYKTALINQLKKRPYWCISRQRSWGVPIPVFYEKSSGSPIINSDTIQHLSTIMEMHGPDCWWNLPFQELLPSDSKYNVNDIKKGQDILDIWFDSGLSWYNVLGNDKVADMYLEGVDQFTGWFQSSLLTSVALRDKAPYKMIYAHGFAVDENGLKMSKSLGNIIAPSDIISGSNGKKPFGIDVLRWWVVCHANQESVAPVATSVLEVSADEVQKIRSILRYALSCLQDYKEINLNYSLLNLVDKYMLHLLYNFNTQINSNAKDYQFSKICSLVLYFITNQISGMYYTSIKDRLYCDSEMSTSRQSAQYVLYNILLSLMKCIGPIVPHLVEEIYSYLPQKQSESFFQIDYQEQDNWDNAEINEIMEVLINIKKQINKTAGANTSDKAIEVHVSKKFMDLLKDQSENVENELCNLFQTAEVKIVENFNIVDDKFELTIIKSNNSLCGRCRRFSSKNINSLCVRCQDVINGKECVNKSELNV